MGALDKKLQNSVIMCELLLSTLCDPMNHEYAKGKQGNRLQEGGLAWPSPTSSVVLWNDLFLQHSPASPSFSLGCVEPSSYAPSVPPTVLLSRLCGWLVSTVMGLIWKTLLVFFKKGAACGTSRTEQANGAWPGWPCPASVNVDPSGKGLGFSPRGQRRACLSPS